MRPLDLNVGEESGDGSSTSKSSVVNSSEHHEKLVVTRQLFPPPTSQACTTPLASSLVQPPERFGRSPDLGTGPHSAAGGGSRRTRRGPRSRSSQYRGVTFYRRTGRWESHIWDCGKQVYLGGFDTAHAAARAYDRAAIKFRGLDADINFNLGDYQEDMKQMRNLSKEDFVHILRRPSTGVARGTSKYLGVSLHKCGRWEARVGQLLGRKACDRAAIWFNGREAVTNFELGTYHPELPSETAKVLDVDDLDLDLRISQPCVSGSSSDVNVLSFPVPIVSSSSLTANSDFNQHKSSTSLRAVQPQILAIPPSPFWTARHTSLPPSKKERPMEKRPDLGLHYIPSWAWQMQGSASLQASSAASSGFATSRL